MSTRVVKRTYRMIAVPKDNDWILPDLQGQKIPWFLQLALVAREEPVVIPD